MFRLMQGDSEELLNEIPDGIIDSVVTDPPYHLTSIVKRFGKPNSAPAQHGKDGAFARASKGFMGKEWDGGDIAFRAEFWAKVLRVLKPGAHLLAFSGSRTYHRMACAIEDAGFEIRDQIQWVYGQGFPKSHDAGNGWGTALKPAHEPICLARKPLIGSVADNMNQYRVGAINIDGCRVDWPNGVAPEIGSPDWGGPSKKSTAVPQQNGKTVEREPPSPLGRWPANLIHDGSDEVLQVFPVVSSGKPSGVKKGNNNAVFGQYNGGIPVTGYGDAGSAARFFYCPKASKDDREKGLENFESSTVGDGRPVAIDNAYQRGKTERRNTHPTVKPTELMRYLCRLITPVGGLVLDPFTGSGSTGKAALMEGFKFIGMEMDADYLEIARARINTSA